MTLGFNFDMALHLPSSHSSSSSHHSLSSHHDSAAIGIHHQHDHLHLQHQNNNNHGYSSYPIKYEPCEQPHMQQQQHQHLTTTMSSSPTTNSSPSSSSSSAAAAAVGASTGIEMIGAHDFLLHQQQISSNSIFDRDFYDSIDSSIMNGNNQQQQLQHHQHQQNHHHRMLSCGSSSDNNNPNGLSIESHDSDESEDDEALMGINLGRNLDDKLHQQQQHHHQLRALEKSSSLNSNSNNNLDRKRPYPCKVCPSKFGSKMELEEHQNSHTGQKPFECEVCKSRFNRRSTLWNHKRIHSDAKPFVCTICHMQFKWKNSLKCHKEMHIRKNETPSIGDIDSDIRQLTYATAAKRKMLEMDGGDSIRSASSLTIFSAAPSTSTNINNGSNCSSNSSNDSSLKNAGQRKRQKLSKKESNSSIKKELMETTTTTATSLTTAAAAAAAADAQQLNLLMNKAFGTQDFDNNNQNNSNNNYQGLMSNQAMRKLTFGNLGGDFDNSFSSNNLMSRDFGADFNLDNSNLDLMNNPLWMQLWNNEQVESMNHFDLHSNRHQNPAASLFGGMDDPSKVLTSGIFDFKDTLGLPNNGNNANNNSSSAAAANHINMLLPKQMINIDLNSLNSFHDSVNQQQRNHSNLPGINHLGSATSFPDYSHDNNTSSLTSQFHLAQNGQSTTSSSSTPSSNGHQPNGHLNSDLTYHQPIDHTLLLNTNHPNDYMLPLEYMTPTGNQSIYPSNDLPLSALTSSHDLLEHSPHSSSVARGMFYHSSSNLSDHHPGCISSQIPNVTASAVAAVQQMR